MSFRTVAAGVGLFVLTVPALSGCGGGGGGAEGESAGEMTEMASHERANRVIALLEDGQPAFGLYAPSARSGGRGQGAADAPTKTSAELATETMAYTMSDYVFNGSMEGRFETAYPPFVEYVEAMAAAGATMSTHPIIVKAPRIADDPETVAAQIGQQLDTGVSGVMFVGVESAEEVRTGLAAMRFQSNGGTRPDHTGMAPTYWGMSEEDYRARADLWPLAPDGELINWTIVESHEGLANVREIAAVPGIGVLWPGAGTLRGLFSSTGEDGQRVLDEEAWEAAIQQVLSACKEFDVACGYPSNASDIEMRMEQGFSVFVMGWGEGGFETIEMGRAAAER